MKTLAVLISAGAAALVNALPASAEPLPESAQAAALTWYVDQNVLLTEVAALPVDERAARLTKAVYSFCQTGDGPPSSQLDSLFAGCVAQCGGYAYVLRGLLEATGAETRFVHLHNIPNQGNHTAVEVRLDDGDWGFFDPTFGVYFTHTGLPDGEPLSLREIAVGLERSDLGNFVNQARKESEDFMARPLELLFNEPFEHRFMSLENYQLAEALSFNDPAEMVILDIKLDAENGEAALGAPSAENFSDAQAAWLLQTNALARDDDPMNDVSFNTSMLYNSSGQKLSTITISGLTPGAVYDLSVALFNQTSRDLSLQLTPLGRSANYGGERVVTLAPGRRLLQEQFRANAPTAQFAVRNMGAGSVIHLTAVAVSESSR